MLALLMFVAILLWNAAPAFACFSEGAMQAEHDCCVVMQNCDAAMTSSCCQLAPKNDTPAVASEYSPEHDQQPGLIWQISYLPSLTDSGANHPAHQAAPAPDPSPGHFSVLRI